MATLKEPEDFDPAFKRWSLAALPFVPDRLGLKVIDEKGAQVQFAVVRRLLRSRRLCPLVEWPHGNDTDGPDSAGRRL